MLLRRRRIKRQPKHCNPKKYFPTCIIAKSRLPVSSSNLSDGRCGRGSLLNSRGGSDGGNGSGSGGDGNLGSSSSLFRDGHSGGDERSREILLRLDNFCAIITSVWCAREREEGDETGNDIGKGFGGSSLALRVPGLHDLDLDTENSLTEQDVSNGSVDEITNRLNHRHSVSPRLSDHTVDVTNLSGVNHETIGELHRLCSGSSQLTRDNNLATLSSRLHDESQHSVTRSVERDDSSVRRSSRVATIDSKKMQ